MWCRYVSTPAKPLIPHRITLKPAGFLFLGVKYVKPPLTCEQQADLVLSRGMIADRAELISRLRVVGYYRLSAYWHPFTPVLAV
jgi:hypothetical protein